MTTINSTTWEKLKNRESVRLLMSYFSNLSDGLAKLATIQILETIISDSYYLEFIMREPPPNLVELSPQEVEEFMAWYSTKESGEEYKYQVYILKINWSYADIYQTRTSIEIDESVKLLKPRI